MSTMTTGGLLRDTTLTPCQTQVLKAARFPEGEGMTVPSYLAFLGEKFLILMTDRNMRHLSVLMLYACFT